MCLMYYMRIQYIIICQIHTYILQYMKNVKICVNVFFCLDFADAEERIAQKGE